MECFFWLIPFCARDLCLLDSCQVRFIFDFFQCIMAGQQFFNFCELFILGSYSFEKFPNYLIMQLQLIFPELILHTYSVDDRPPFRGLWAHGEQNSQSHVFGQLVSSAFSGVVEDFPRLGWCVRGRLFGQLSAVTRFACCRSQTHPSC